MGHVCEGLACLQCQAEVRRRQQPAELRLCNRARRAAEAKVAELTDIIRNSAPLTWVAEGDMEGAREWEVLATQAIEGEP